MPNFCTLNPLNKTTSATLSKGNLVCTNGANDQGACGTFAMLSGKWYWEIYWDNGAEPEFGVMPVNQAHVLPNRSTIGSFDASAASVITNTGGVRTPAWTTSDGTGANANTGAGWAAVAVDCDAGKMWMRFKTGSWYNSGDPANGTNPQFTFDADWLSQTSGLFPFALSGTGAGKTWKYNFGQFDWAHTPPTGFSALSTENLPAPAIQNPEDYFKIVKYAGNNGTQSVTVGWQPDLIWAKNRDTTGYHHELYDSIRGDNKRIFSSQNTEEITGYLAFQSDGFSLTNGGGINNSPDQHVAWCWKAGGTASTNNAGTIATQVSVNTDAKFSVFTYTGNATNNATIGHGLNGTAPEFVMIKNRSGGTSGSAGGWWSIYHKNLQNKHMYGFNDQQGSDASWDNHGKIVTVSGTTITLSQGDQAENDWWNNDSNANYVGYCWAGVEGFSKFGSFVGASNAPFVYLGFTPAFVLFKKIDNSNAAWAIRDNTRYTFNPTRNTLYPNKTDAEYTGTLHDIDFLSNGFKVRNADGLFNTAGATYIYAAFAESPMKYATAQ